jgi:GntR family transcriptional repressor for pyruvate dehydrogenase complex
MFKTLDRRKAHEQVADRIREHVMLHTLQVGERLPTERELAEQFGVSRTAVREGLRMLELGGLVTVKKGPKGGIFVDRSYDRPITDSILNLLAGGHASLENLFEMRELIEPYAASRASVLGTDEEFAEIAEFLRETERQAAAGTGVRGRNIDFHRRIIQLSRNPIMSAVAETVLSILTESTLHLARSDLSAQHVGSHAEILAAIRRRDSRTARVLMARDIQSMREDYAASEWEDES